MLIYILIGSLLCLLMAYGLPPEAYDTIGLDNTEITLIYGIIALSWPLALLLVIWKAKNNS